MRAARIDRKSKGTAKKEARRAKKDEATTDATSAETTTTAAAEAKPAKVRLWDAQIVRKDNGRKIRWRGVVQVVLGVVRDVEQVMSGETGEAKKQAAAEAIAARIEIKNLDEAQEVKAIGQVIDAVVLFCNLGWFAWTVSR